MTVEFTSVARGNPQDPSAPKKYYPVARSTGDLTLPGLAERAAEISTLSSVDVAAAVEAFLAIIPQALSAAHSQDHPRHLSSLQGSKVVRQGKQRSLWLVIAERGMWKSPRKSVATKEPDALIAHVRDCGGRGG